MAISIRKNAIYIILFASMVLIFNGLAVSPSLADEREADWGRKGVEVGGKWGQPEGTGVWSDMPNLLDSSYMYSYELVCFDDDVGYLFCLNANACEDGPDGKYVVWKRSVRVNPPLWEDFTNNGPACVYSEDPEALLEEVTSLLLTEFQEHPVNAGTIASQPGPHTMVGADTNIYVESQVQVIKTQLLGQDVRIVATPSEYVVNYGDGTQGELTYDAGVPLPDLRIGEQTATSHVYRTTGDFQIYATVYFTAEYSLNGGPMIPIDGRGVFDTPPEVISVWRSESRNVADDCLQNPSGFGC